MIIRTITTWAIINKTRGWVFRPTISPFLMMIKLIELYMYSGQFLTLVKIMTCGLLRQRRPKRPAALLPAILTCQQAQHGSKEKASSFIPNLHQSGVSPIRIHNPQVPLRDHVDPDHSYRWQPSRSHSAIPKLQPLRQRPSLKTSASTLVTDHQCDLCESRNQLHTLIFPQASGVAQLKQLWQPYN